MAVQSGASPSPPPFWLRLGLERAGPVKGCGLPDCPPDSIDPVDVYCERHGNFLIGRPGVGRTVVLNACRVVICLTFWAAAEFHGDLLLATCGLIIGGFVLGYPLRHYPVAQALAVIAWPVSALATIGFRAQSESVRLGALLFFAGVALLLALIHTAVLTVMGGPRRPEQPPPPQLAVAGAVAACFAIAIGAGAGVLALRAQSRLDTTVAQMFLGFVCVSVGTVGLVVLAANAFVASFHRVTASWVPRKPARWRWAPVDRSAARSQRPDAVDQIGRAFATFTATVITFLRMLFYYAILTIVRAWSFFMAALAEAIAIVGRALRVGMSSLVQSVLVVFLPLLLMLLGAFLIDVWAAWSVDYAVSGDPYALMIQVLNGAGALGTLTLAWMILSGESPREVFHSAGRSASIAGANALVLLAAGGWVIGSLSTVLSGSIRVGWATATATAIVIVVTVWSRLRR